MRPFLRMWLAAIYRRHDVLRLRFYESQDDWRSEYLALQDDLVDTSFSHVDMGNMDEESRTLCLKETGERLQESFSLLTGPLMKVAYFDAEEASQRRLLLVLHHGVVDGVSWRILLDDLSFAYEQHTRGEPVMLADKTSSYQRWAEALVEYGRSEAFAEEISYWQQSLGTEVPALPRDEPVASSNVEVYQFNLGEAQTEQLLRQSPAAYRTQVNELLLAAVWSGIYRWSGNVALRIWMEGHGREDIFESLDVTQTMGWFTSLYPLTLDVQAKYPGEIIKQVKEQYRALPNRGLGYGIARYLSEDIGLPDAGDIEVTFNYLGQFDQTVNSETAFQAGREFTGRNVAEGNPREALLNISGQVVSGSLVLGVDYDSGCYRAQTMAHLGSCIKESLLSLIEHCCEPGAGSYTPSDFTLTQVSQLQLDQWQRRYDNIEDIYPTVPMQQGMLFHRLLDDEAGAYLGQITYRIRGPLQCDKLRAAWQHLISRHVALRTAFVGLEDENIQQLVLADATLPWYEQDLSMLDEAAQEAAIEAYQSRDREKGIDLEHAPSMRVGLFDLGGQKYHQVWSYFMGAFDGWSLPIINQELFACYRSLCQGQVPSLPRVQPYQSYMQWLIGQDPAQAASYWSSYLEGFEETTPLSIVKLLGDVTTAAPAWQGMSLSLEVSEQLEQLAKGQQVTMNVIVQAAWAYLLSRYSGQSDVVFGTTVSGRPSQVSGVEQIVGLFINTIPSRVDFSLSGTLGELLGHIHGENIRREEFSYMPLADIQKLSELPQGSAMFDSYLVFQNYPVEDAIEQQGLVANELIFEIQSEDAKSDYGLDVSATYQGILSFKVEYRKDVYAHESINRLLGHLEQILVGMAEGGAGVALSSIRLLTEEEGQQLADWNQTDFDYDREAGLGALFSAQAARTPDNIALCNGSESLRYEALDRQSNRLAHYLLSLGLQADDVVGIYLPGGCELGVALLSVIKAGGRFLLLDTQYPDSRLAYMLKDSGAGYLLGTAAHPVSFDPQDLIVVEMDRIDMSSQSSEATGLVARGGDDGIGVFYTSGSTGQPKGVLYSHRNLVNYSQSMQEVLGSCAQDRVWQLASVSFDVILEELLPAWLSGGTVVVNESEGLLGAGELQESMGDLSISVLELSFAQWREWLYWLQVNNEVPPPSLRVVMVGCEAIPVRLMRQWVAYDVALVHVFGLTETAITSSTWHSKAWDEGLSGSLPSGKPMGNTRLHVLDMAQQLQPVGVAGELYIGGDGVTEGYIHQEALTESRFVDLPWIDSGRLYRTGDKVRWREDGNIEFIGRMDNQVKVRGYRIEPGEIEARLRQLPQVQDAVVLVREEEGHDKQLVAYVVAEQTGGEEDGLVSDIRTGLLRHLPGYMIPSYFLLLESLPLTLSGKVDKQALPAPGSQYLEQSGYVAPRNELESQLCAIWSSALRVERVGITDNFFELGGDSIISIQIASRASQAGINLSVRQLFEHQNIADVVANLDSHVRVDAFQGEVIGEQILLPIHHWFFAEKQVKPEHNNMSLLLVPPADVDEAFLRMWLAAIYRRHDVLRLRFYESQDDWRSEYLALQDDLVDTSFSHVDMGNMDEESRTLCLKETGERLQESFSLLTGPLMKVAYFDAEEASQRRLLLVLHHGVVDGVSWRILLDDLSFAYEQHTRGEPVMLADKTSSYQRWAEALVEYGRSEAFAEEISYWQQSLGTEVPALPRDEPVASSNVEVYQFNLGEAQTEQLLRQSPAAYRTQVNELLLAAVWSGIYRWSGNVALRIWMEGHGREDIFESLDVTQTMGWFTSLYPLTLDVQAKYPGEIIKQVKEQYRALPNRGLGYGIARYLSEDIGLPDAGDIEVTFNYLGQFDQTVNSETAFQAGREFTGRNVAEGNPREALLNISGQVVSGSLVLGVDYDSGCYRAQTMAHLGSCIKESLLSLIEHCCEPGAGSYTPSDFTLTQVSQLQLDQWQRRYDNIEDIYPTVPMQQGMLFHRLLDDEAGAYLGQITYRIRGPLQCDKLRAAWQHLISRHVALRTAFVGLEDENIQQLVLADATLPWYEQDLSMLDEAAQEAAIEAYQSRDREKGIDLEHAPSMRVGLFDLGGQKYHQVWSYFMGAFDGWSLPIINQELFACYRSLCQGQVPSLPRVQPYQSYMQWLIGQDPAQAASYWSSYLEGFEETTPLSIVKLLGDVTTAAPAWQGMSLSLEVSEQLEQLAKGQQVTMNVIVQAAWAYLLSRYSGQSDVVFGTTVSGRPSQVSGVEQIVGLFINTIPSRVDFSLSGTLGELLGHIHGENIRREEFSYMPLADIQKLSELPQGSAMFDSYLVFQNYPVEDVIEQKRDDLGLSFENSQSYEASNYKLMLLAENGKTLQMGFKYSSNEYSQEVISILLGHLGNVISQMATLDPDSQVTQLSLLSEQERCMLLSDWGNGDNVTGLNATYFIQQFEKQVVNEPDAIAVIADAAQLTYGELNSRANRLAHYLIEQGVSNDIPVALCLSRTPQMLIGLMAILKAGGAYVPIDASYPEERVRYLLADAKVSLVISETAIGGSLPLEGQALMCLDDSGLLERLQQQPESNPGIVVSSGDMAYVIYTSGTTGQPKGVMVTHEGLMNYVSHVGSKYLPQIQGGVVSLPLVFDATVTTLLSPLCHGCFVELLGEGDDALERLEDYLLDDEERLLFKLTPAHLDALWASGRIESNEDIAHVIVIGGEQLTVSTMEKWQGCFPNAVFINEYGPTETVVGCSVFTVTGEGLQGENVPIGKPIQNTQLYCLDEQMQLLPSGVVGELYIGGAGVARGYLGRESLTAERFVDDPFGGKRLYRTGDRVRWRHDGQLAFLGRNDNQVKVRGYRIELDEIESALAAIPELNANAVIVHEDAAGNKHLVAYVVPTKKSSKDNISDICRIALTARLPEFMVPTIYIPLDAMPLTNSGKVDRRALPDPLKYGKEKSSYVPPRNEVEQQLCEIWQEVLNIPQVGIEDNFFALGGDSIISIQVVSRAKRQGLHFTVRQLFDHQCIAKLAETIGHGSEVEAIQTAVTGDLALLPVQRAFFGWQLPVENHYNQSVLLTTPEGFDAEALRAIVQSLYERHDALRLRFESKNLKGLHEAFSTEMLEASMEVHDFSDVSLESREALLLQTGNEAQGSFDISKGVLFKAVYMDIGEQGGRLLLLAHHLVIDGVSWRIVLSDLEAGWEQYRLGEEITLPEKSSSLQQWGEALQEYAMSHQVQAQKAYWSERLSLEVARLPGSGEGASGTSGSGFSLDEESTIQLLGECNEAYRTRINELLLCGLLMAYQQWSGNHNLRLLMEGHGREELFEHLDVNDTVGWFTSLYPLILSNEGELSDDSRAVGELIKQVKEQYRGVPDKGIGYGLLRYLDPESGLEALEAAHNPPQIEFNYLGQFDNTINQNSAFIPAKESAGSDSDPANPSSVDLSINGMVHKGCLRFSISNSAVCKDVELLAQAYKQALLTCIEHCMEINVSRKLYEEYAKHSSDDELAEDGIEI